MRSNWLNRIRLRGVFRLFEPRGARTLTRRVVPGGRFVGRFPPVNLVERVDIRLDPRSWSMSTTPVTHLGGDGECYAR